MGCTVSFRFPIVKLIDYKAKGKWDKLKKSDNPFAIVVQTHLKGLETLNSSKQRYDEKVELFKALHEAHYSEKEIFDLFRFMDWVLGLPDKLEQQFNDFAKQYEEEKEMPYVTSIERFGIEKGIQLGTLQKSREYVTDILKLRFKRVPKSLTNQIQTLDDAKFLSTLHKNAVLVDSLKTFKQLLEQQK